MPGDANFPLNALYAPPRDRNDADLLRQYLTQARQELVLRLVDKIYVDGVPSKYWMAFTKRKLYVYYSSGLSRPLLGIIISCLSLLSARAAVRTLTPLFFSLLFFFSMGKSLS